MSTINSTAFPTLIALPILLVVILLGIGIFIFWIWMLIDCLASNRPGLEKLLWFILIFFFHILGALLYFLVGRQTQYRTR